jgi:predicted Zn-ribbon and HTH transcriptional regulator
MKRVALVVVDPVKARQRRIDLRLLGARHQLEQSERQARRLRSGALHPSVQRSVERRLARIAERVARDEPQTSVGALWTVASSVDASDPFACPCDRPNCRNCGDPAFEAQCAAAGHCPQCGRAGAGGHGVAPQSVLAAAGLETRILEDDEDDVNGMWDEASRRFAARTGSSNR